MANKIQLRRDTAQNWADVNPILGDGEPGFVIDTNQVKYGDGSTPWNDLGWGGTGLNPTSVAVGVAAGNINQGEQSTAVGLYAGTNSQGLRSVAVGAYAGQTNQGANAVAVGNNAGNERQGAGAVAIGYDAGGDYSGNTTGNNQGINAVAIGNSAGRVFQGANSIAIGAHAGYEFQTTSSIVINATGAPLNSAGAGLYVKPVRNVTTTTGLSQVWYDPATGEFVYYTP